MTCGNRGGISTGRGGTSPRAGARDRREATWGSAGRETPTYNPADERPRPHDAFLADCAGVGGAMPRDCLLQSRPGAIDVDRRGAFREHPRQRQAYGSVMKTFDPDVVVDFWN